MLFFNSSQNQREKNREAKLVLKASGQTVTIEDPKSSSKRSFTFDYSYWSHDGFEEDETGYFYPVNSTYADQVSDSCATSYHKFTSALECHCSALAVNYTVKYKNVLKHWR